jgi:hypothetical protein
VLRVGRAAQIDERREALQHIVAALQLGQVDVHLAAGKQGRRAAAARVLGAAQLAEGVAMQIPDFHTVYLFFMIVFSGNGSVLCVLCNFYGFAWFFRRDLPISPFIQPNLAISGKFLEGSFQFQKSEISNFRAFGNLTKIHWKVLAYAKNGILILEENF